MIWLAAELKAWLGEGEAAMQRVFGLTGEVFREPPGAGRRTLRVEHAGRGYFLKLHLGVGWREIFKNLLTLKRPVIGARNEWQAIRRLDELGIETMQLLGYGESGWNPARRRSFVITRELNATISLEDYCRSWLDKPPDPRHRRRLIRRLARIARILHSHGVNHRDFYLCHFFLSLPWDGSETALHLYLIDLHRMQWRAHMPQRWAIKDVGSLWFSAREIHVPLSRADRLRFVREYTGLPLREALADGDGFWAKVSARADALYATRPTPGASSG